MLRKLAEENFNDALHFLLKETKNVKMAIELKKYSILSEILSLECENELMSWILICDEISAKILLTFFKPNLTKNRCEILDAILLHQRHDLFSVIANEGMKLSF